MQRNQLFQGFVEVEAKELLGQFGVAGDDRLQKFLVFGRDLGRLVVCGLELGETEGDLGLKSEIGALKARTVYRFNDRLVKALIRPDDFPPRRFLGEVRHLGDRSLGGRGNDPGLPDQANCLEFQGGPQLEDVGHVRCRKYRHLDAAVGFPLEQPLSDQNLGGGPEGVAGDAKTFSVLVFTQAVTRR